MQEFIELQKRCLYLLQSHSSCGHSCSIAHFCEKNGCDECDCSKCLNEIQRGEPPKFTYCCERITYQYVLRFFNRFASEIYYAISLYKMDNPNRINIVSLGCGPGSEIYGILWALRQRGFNSILHYEGHDLVEAWEPVQQLSKECLAHSGHNINFYTTDLFNDFHGFDNGVVNLLILNYLLSDSVKFSTKQQNIQFIERIADFIIQNRIKNVLFNDIWYYGSFPTLNSGVQLIKLLIQKLKNKGARLSVAYKYFEKDGYIKNENWQPHPSDRLQFQDIKANKYALNINYCNSKQVFIRLNAS